jgi:uncharacterized RmlC-like cupin family protein
MNILPEYSAMALKSATSVAKKPVLVDSAANGKFSVSHAAASEFKVDGLRPFFAYRDLGMKDATNGRFVAHVIRAVPGKSMESCWHRHQADFHMVYVLKGWIEFEYESVGKQRYVAGSCFYQPKNIGHVELGHSDDIEMIEIVAPGDFVTTEDPKV